MHEDAVTPDGLPLVSTDLLDQLGDAVTVVDRTWHYRYVSPGAALLIGKAADEVVGQYVWDVFPEVVGTGAYDIAVRAMDERVVQSLEWHFETVDRWYEQRFYPTEVGLVIVVSDINDRMLAAQRSERLLAVGEALAGALTTDDVAAAFTRHALPLVNAAGGMLVLVDEAHGVAHSHGWSGMHETQTRWREWSLSVNTPSLQAYRSRSPVQIASLAEIEAQFPAVVDDMKRLQRESVISMPLQSSGRCIGALTVTFEGRRLLNERELELLGTVAAMCAQALVRAELYEGQKRGVDALQRSLLPPLVAEVDDIDIAVRYAPGETGIEVGGDWYDVITIPGEDAAVIVIGDVEGHDLAAAALMGLMRSAVRAYTLERHAPAAVLQLANTFLQSLAYERLVTVLIAQLHPQESLITVVSAGHPSALLASDSAVLQLPVETGPPLGVVTRGDWPETTTLLPNHGTLAFFTDGLVEARGRDIDEGVAEAANVLLAAHERDVEQLADALLQARHASRLDDVAIVVARLTVAADPAARAVSRRLPPTSASVLVVRRFVRQVLAAWDIDPAMSDDVELVLSELATNAARDSEDAFEMRLSHPANCLRLDVSDNSHRLPRVTRSTEQDETSGRGLVIVEAIASRWGVESYGLGKSVWCEFDLAT